MECEACKIALKTLDNLAGENASISKIKETAYDICNKLTGIQLQQIVYMCLKLSIDHTIQCLSNGNISLRRCLYNNDAVVKYFL